MLHNDSTSHQRDQESRTNIYINTDTHPCTCKHSHTLIHNHTHTGGQKIKDITLAQQCTVTDKCRNSVCWYQ